MMSLVRSLFWFALVALLFPRGLELHDSIRVPAIHMPFGAEIDVPRIMAADPIETYRNALFARLTEVRAELARVESRRGPQGLLAALPRPKTWN